jgi:endonuclease/exonuclease/phosphatase family metal-dependent hydrolase
MKRTLALALVLLVTLPVASGLRAAPVKPPKKISPPGQVQIATVNARQNKILGFKRFEALFELARAFRFRPPGFNGGTRGAVIAPDVAVISEFRELQVEVFARLLRVRFDEPYEIVGPSDVQAAIIVNTDTLTLQGEVELIDDVCLNDETSEKPRFRREYPMARLVESATGAPLSVVGVHLARDYSASEESDCLARNVTEIRDRLENEPGAAFAAGDFNFRPVEIPHDCDRDEQSAPVRWWSLLTTPEDGGRAYVDAVREYRRARNESMADEWTYQHPDNATLCDGRIGVRRSRIDYIFASGTTVAEAHADHPGWLDRANYKYSDHRYVLGRFILSGPPRPQRPTAIPDAGGLIHLTWESEPETTGWILYRARPGTQYTEIARLPGTTVAFDDSATEHATRYRYSLAPLGVDGGQGLESAGTWTEADARGPHVNSVAPPAGATGVKPTVTVRVTFDEWVDSSSLTDATVSLYRNGIRIRGQIIRKGGFVLLFDPSTTLRKGDAFTIVVRPVADVLGNLGSTFRSRFQTIEPPKRKGDRRR